MSLLRMLKQAGDGEGVTRLASPPGLDAGQAETLVSMLAPAIGTAARKRAASRGLPGLLSHLKGDAQADLHDRPELAQTPEGQAQGRRFLETLLGSNAATEQLVQEASDRSGVDAASVQQFLFALAAVLQGGMQKQTPDTSIETMLIQLHGGITNQSGGFMAMLQGRLSTQNKDGPDLTALTNMLDADGEGSDLDDVLGRVMK